MTPNEYFYRAYGLEIFSEIICPELEESEPGREPDVRIRQGAVPENLGEPKYSGFKCEVNDSSILIRTDRVAKLLISGGNQVFVEKREGASEYEVRSLLLGWGLGAVLHQRGIFPLHASAVAMDQGCLAFCAPSGGGKSTLAYAFLKRGYQLMDDDTTALKSDLGIPMVLPGYPEIKLWGDVLGNLTDEYLRVRPVLRETTKFALDARDHFQRDIKPLIRIYVITRGSSLVPRLTRLKGGAAFHAVSENAYCTRFLKGTAQLAKHFEMLVKLTERVAVFTLEFPANLLPPDELVEIIEDSF